MARRNPWFSFESDNDDIDLEQDVTGTVTELDETAVDEAGEDSETTDVTPDTNETSHNEVASAGGVATGNNLDQLEMDPVAASESYIRRVFGLSREDMEEATDQIEAKSEAISEEPVGSGDSEVDSYVSDAEESGGEVIDADETGIDEPALDSGSVTIIATGDVVDGDSGDDDTDEAMEDWYRSLEGDDGCDDKEKGCDDKKDNSDDDDESSEWWM